VVRRGRRGHDADADRGGAEDDGAAAQGTAADARHREVL
jgi:hypothetical protein